MNVYCIGSGAPTVVLDLGWGDPLIAWAWVQPEIAKFTRVCSYERAGYGFSDPAPLPRDTRARVADFNVLLSKAGIAPPYVLVAHSFGGLDARLYAELYPKRVAGMVLVDPAVEGFQELAQAVPERKNASRF